MTETKLAPCAWCNRDVMDYNASFNGKDICADCEEDVCQEDYPDTFTFYTTRMAGNPVAQCLKCDYKAAYWECACDLIHDCEEDN